jgi:phytoene dehydrogenase-like protein
MLEAGGLPILSDDARKADESNPEGYREMERVKELARGGDASWLREARGRAIKIIAYYLPYLPPDLNYRVVFMQRDLTEVLASQRRMLAARDETSDADDERLQGLFRDHLGEASRLLSERPCFESLEVRYREVIDDPERVAATVAGFLGGGLDVRAMAATVKPELYRNRATHIPGAQGPA